MIGYNDAGRERAVVEMDGEERNGELRGEFIEGRRVNAIMDARQRALCDEGRIDVQTGRAIRNAQQYLVKTDRFLGSISLYDVHANIAAHSRNAI